MKRMLALTLALLMISVPALSLAAAADEKIVVYAAVPDDWAYPCVWAWNEAGENAFSVWPGEQMEPDPANEGWYYIYLPAGMEKVIVSANDGAVQTSDCGVDKQNAWLTVSEDLTAAVSFEKQTAGEAPEYSERYTVYAMVDETWGTPALWAWKNDGGKGAFPAWPGRQMKANANGWYSARVPVWCDSIIVNADGGSVKTEDIKDLDPADLWIKVAADAAFELTYIDPTAPQVEDITVYAKVPEDWAEPCLWAWSHPDGTNAFTAWPGEKLTADESGWYKISVGGFINTVIINANGGAVQTADISVDSGKDIYLTVTAADAFELSYEMPAN